MPDRRTIAVVAAGYQDIAAADGDQQAVSRLCCRAERPSHLETVLIGRTSKGTHRIYLGSNGNVRPCAYSLHDSSCLALAMALLLYPAAAVDLPEATPFDRARLDVLAGYLSQSISRAEIKRLGERLDQSDAGLIVTAEHDLAHTAMELMSGAAGIDHADLVIDPEDVSEELDVARRAVTQTERIEPSGSR